MPTALITGSTDGIGAALAAQLEEAGWNVIRHGRRPAEQVGAGSPSHHLYCRADLLEPEAAAQAIATFLDEHSISKLDLLVHNAATGFAGPIDRQSPKNLRALLATNLYAPLEITRLLSPLLATVDGKVVLIGSVVSTLPCADFAVYAASKAALAGFARSLKAEGDMRVQIIHPGATRTGLHAKSGFESEKIATFADPDAVAGKILRAVLRADRDRVLGLRNHLAFTTGRLARTPMAKFVGRKRRPARPTTTPPHCAITGGAAGIGAALAAVYRLHGYRVTTIDIAPSADIVADLSTQEELELVLSELGPVDLFIHNAGINAVARFAESDPERNRKLLDLNLAAPLLLSAALARRSAPPEFIFIASLSCQLGYPGAAAYAASKDGVASFAASLCAAGHRTLTVFPGPTRTAHAALHSPDNSREHRRMPPEALARKIFKAHRKGKTCFVPGLANKLLAATGRLLPRTMSRLMRRAILPNTNSPD
jgi:short-subunit dehydrogenase